ncbi:hypothetical protein VXQ18_12385 [Brucella abortus]|nr:hypothetical protein [Brucella abortus]
MELTLVRMTNHVARHTNRPHALLLLPLGGGERPTVRRFCDYRRAPVEAKLPFREVTYWDEMRRVFDWTQSHVAPHAEHLLGRAGCGLSFPRHEKI